MRASALDTGVSSEGQGVASYYLEASSEKKADGGAAGRRRCRRWEARARDWRAPGDAEDTDESNDMIHCSRRARSRVLELTGVGFIVGGAQTWSESRLQVTRGRAEATERCSRVWRTCLRARGVKGRQGSAGIAGGARRSRGRCRADSRQPGGRGEVVFGGKERGGRGDLTSVVTARNYSGIMAN